MVIDCLHQWLKEQVKERPELLRIDILGSYARGDWGVSSDLDLILVVKESRTPFWQRALEWDTAGFPVLVDILIYIEEEWREMAERCERFYHTIQKEVVWVLSQPQPK